MAAPLENEGSIQGLAELVGQAADGRVVRVVRRTSLSLLDRLVFVFHKRNGVYRLYSLVGVLEMLRSEGDRLDEKPSTGPW